MENRHAEKASAAQRQRMPISQRAKQFMPFAAVTGLEAALAAKEAELGISGETGGDGDQRFSDIADTDDEE